MSNPVSDAFEGTVSAFVKLSIEGIKKIAEDFKNRKIAFVQDKSTLEKVKEDLKSNEFKFYKSYISDSNLTNQILMGLTMRRLEEEGKIKEIKLLRDRIFSKFDINGVHIAQTVQNGIISRYIIYLNEMHISEKILKEKLNKLLQNIDDFIYFVKSFNIMIIEESNIIVTKMNTLSTEVFIISGMGNAVKNTNEIIKHIDEKGLKNYSREDYSRKNRRIAFFHKLDE